MAGGSATQVVGVKMPSGETLWARVTVDPASVTDSALGFKRVLGRLENLEDTIRGVVHSVAGSVARYSPAETEVEFGIEIAGETGMAVAVLAGAHAAASVKIKMTWRKGEFPAAVGGGGGVENGSAAGPGSEPGTEPAAQPAPDQGSHTDQGSAAEG